MEQHGIRAVAPIACIAVACVLLLTLPGCGGGGDGTPKAVTENFVHALVQHDANGSFRYLSDKFKNEYGITGITWSGLMMRDPIPQTATFTVTGENVQGDTATVTIAPTGGVPQNVNLIKEGGNWHVDYAMGQWYGLVPGLR